MTDWMIIAAGIYLALAIAWALTCRSLKKKIDAQRTKEQGR